MNESLYYEEETIWHPHRYEDADQQRRFEATAAALPAEVGSLLDVGCGNGAFLRYLETTGAAFELRGVERAEAAIAASVCRTAIDLGSIDALPYSDGAFGAVSALEVIEHLPQPIYATALEELGRVASRYVVISVPYRERRRNVRCPMCDCAFHPSHHVRSFTSADMASLIPRFVLGDLRTITASDYLGGPLLRAGYRLIARGDDMPPGALCPQCGYRHRGGSGRAPLRARQALRSPLRRLLPARRRANWYVGVYHRT